MLLARITGAVIRLPHLDDIHEFPRFADDVVPQERMEVAFIDQVNSTTSKFHLCTLQVEQSSKRRSTRCERPKDVHIAIRSGLAAREGARKCDRCESL